MESRALALLLGLLVPGLGWAQTPLGAEFQVNQNVELTQQNPQIAVTAPGTFAIGWLDSRGDTFPFTPFAVARFYDAQGRPFGDEIHLNQREFGSFPWLLAAPHGGYRSYWIGGGDTPAPFPSFLQNWTPQGQLLGPRWVHGPSTQPFLGVYQVVGTPAGKIFVTGFVSRTQLVVGRLDARGELLGKPVPLATALSDIEPFGPADLEVDQAGHAVVTWGEGCGSFDDPQCDVFAQRLSERNEKLGEPIRVNRDTAGNQVGGGLAVSPDGSFLVTWLVRVPELFSGADEIRAQRFSPLGERLGRELRLAVPPRGGLFRVPEAAADPHGNYLVVWPSFHREDGRYGWDILGQLFRHDGRKVGRQLNVNTRNTFNEIPEPKIAFGGNGTFVVVWNADDGDFDGVYAQRFAASMGDEPCRVRDAHLLCDTGRTGGEAELDLDLPGGEIVLGDVDGDGRKDPCVFAAGRFQCDTDHRGLPYEVSLRFGQEGDVPLFEDIDGDGREEPCVRRDRFFRCDTGHDGGRAEVAFPLGTAADQPLLGDLDGDGRVEACVYQATGRFLCDLRHRGRADFALPFGGEAGDVAGLGDFDGDGRADPCVIRGGRWLCDTAHDGGTAEAQLSFGDSGDRPLLGNLDGL
jgi:hypothetical protein